MPSQIKAPYQVAVPIAKTKEVKDLLANKLNAVKRRYQWATLEARPLSYGVMLRVDVFGYNVGFTGTTKKGVTKSEWDELTADITAIFKDFWPDVASSKEEWTDAKKFNFVISAHIQYAELRPL